MASGVFAFASAFLACAVELVEAATIVLAVGFTRGWRPALAAAALSTVLAAAAIAVFGPALERIPLDDLRLVVGILLLFFGLQWLKKAILRASGRKAKRDEDAKYVAEVEERAGRAVPRSHSSSRRPGRRAGGRSHRADARRRTRFRPA